MSFTLTTASNHSAVMVDMTRMGASSDGALPSWTDARRLHGSLCRFSAALTVRPPADAIADQFKREFAE